MMDRQRRQMRSDVAWMIRQSLVSGTIYRPQTEGADSFFGSHEPVEVEIGSIPIEMKQLSPKDLAEIGADALASVLPESGIAEKDFLVVNGIRYRISEVKSHNCFGAVTHLDLHLELEKKSNG